MSFPASHTVNNRDVWWFICKRWWRGKCSVLQTRARIHLFSSVMSSKVCPAAQRPFSSTAYKEISNSCTSGLSHDCCAEFAAAFVNMGFVHNKSHGKPKLVRGKLWSTSLKLCRTAWSKQSCVSWLYPQLQPATFSFCSVWLHKCFLFFMCQLLFTPLQTFRTIKRTTQSHKQVSSHPKVTQITNNNIFIKQENS